MTGHCNTLVTVSSPAFMVGTQVMLQSFLTHNPWFDGSVTVFHADLGDADQALLEADFPNLECRMPPLALTRAIDRLVVAMPDLANRRDRFLSLAAFAPRSGTDDAAVLFCDSDILFQGSVQTVAQATQGLTACPDAVTLRGARRWASNFAETDQTGVGTLAGCFNAGLMGIAPTCRTAEVFDRLLGRLDPAVFSAIRTGHTDQAVLNLELQDRITLADPVHNLLLGSRADMRNHASQPLDAGRALHFNGPAKPWLPDRHLAAALRDPAHIDAVSRWNAAHRQFLTQAVFRRAR